MNKKLVDDIRKKTYEYFQKANIVLTNDEINNIEVADFGLNDIEKMGLQLVTYINTSRYCAKEMVLFPKQTCPEHKHPKREDNSEGKMETFRCRWGEVYLYVEGERTSNPIAILPKEYGKNFTVFKEIVLEAGQQFTIKPNTLHWFQAGDKGAVISEFSSNSDDSSDIFTDKNIKRLPEY
ncbi:D-lyxose/D-mannose family sugar isomerase [Maledivibacter halophilus]|uniref:D-lyxose ketol-isomerase n=1 Tax=Maledivibacter halophilus TaxID=36842 RepID=A0A1T5K658_9FIRM|nr:D-lyxose/D-mannose family sugar isomerase [Maledivibacter halophilus]SKC59015.1 D-lyxose ketol-isomerase [Maledivibacter halophilus]